MFGWFKPRCPLDTRDKTWLEMRMRWLADEFSFDRLLQSEVILPTDEFFPERYDGHEEDALVILKKLAGWMQIDLTTIDLEVVSEEEMPNAAGQYVYGERKTIRLAQSQLEDPLQLTATLAHELSHELLLGHGRTDRGTADEWTTDMLPVFLGVGIFSANATLNEKHLRLGNESWWSIGHSGYLSSAQFGYALALFAFARGERRPTWGRYLRPDAREPFQQGLRYLHVTNDSLFHPDTVRQSEPERAAAEWSEELDHSFASRRMRAIWEIAERQYRDAIVIDALVRRLSDHDSTLQIAAAGLLGELNSGAEAAGPILLKHLRSAGENLQAASAVALGRLGFDPRHVVPELARAVKADTADPLHAAAIRGLGYYGREAESAVQPLTAALIKGLVDCSATAELAAEALLAVTDDPKRFLRTECNADRELYRDALHILEAAAGCGTQETGAEVDTTPRTTS